LAEETDSRSKIQRRRWERKEPRGGVWAERRRLAAALRRVIAHLTVADTPEDELRTAAERLEDYATHLERHPRRPYLGFAETAIAQGPSSRSETEPDEAEELGGGHFDLSPLIGHSNPLAPPIHCWAEADHALGKVVFGTPYEGPPGHVHGGYVAAAFDEVLGYAQALTGQPGMTGTLTVKYRRPTPLHTELRFDCWVDRISGRKVFASGTLHDGDTLCAEAEGIFVSMGPERFRALVEARQRQRPEGPEEPGD
jgi:acyl-coenzyme A thioesterase PaaI-like protein